MENETENPKDDETNIGQRDLQSSSGEAVAQKIDDVPTPQTPEKTNIGQGDLQSSSGETVAQRIDDVPTPQSPEKTPPEITPPSLVLSDADLIRPEKIEERIKTLGALLLNDKDSRHRRVCVAYLSKIKEHQCSVFLLEQTTKAEIEEQQQLMKAAVRAFNVHMSRYLPGAAQLFESQINAD